MSRQTGFQPVITKIKKSTATFCGAFLLTIFPQGARVEKSRNFPRAKINVSVVPTTI
jgi:hypothetical protein